MEESYLRLFRDSDPPQVPQYQYSSPVKPYLYYFKSYFTTFLPRIHQDAQLATEGSQDLYKDWVKNVGSTDSIGCLNKFSGHLAALLAPECLPERLKLLGYMLEFGFLHDGKSINLWADIVTYIDMASMHVCGC
jgi:hypothetical protein